MKHDPDFHFFFICLNDEVESLMKNMELTNATLINIKDIENEDRELANVKTTRNDKEYIWTAKASVLLYIINHFLEIDHIVWLDGDTAFFSDPQPIFDEWKDYSIFLTEEKFIGKYEWLGRMNGFYNTGFMGFKRDENSLECLKWFREKLIEWCFDKHERGLWSDQVYVNDWTDRFNNVGVAENLGINVTPFILLYTRTELGYIVTLNDNNIYINDRKLILFHYYGFKYFDGNVFDLCGYEMEFTDEVIEWIYLPYILECNEVMEQIAQINKDFYLKKSIKDIFIMNYFNLDSNINEDRGKYSFCTMVGEQNLLEGLGFYDSLKKHAKKFYLWIYCKDDTTYLTLANMKLENVFLINLKNIKDKRLFKKLLKVKNSGIDYQGTLKAPFIFHILKNNYNIHYMIYADPDTRFVSNVTDVFRKWKRRPVYIFNKRIDKNAQYKYGKNMESVIGFKRSKRAFNYLRRRRNISIKG